MNENKQQSGSAAKQGSPLSAEEEHYEEPPRMTRKDTWGVVVALVLLAVIAVAGYVWLTPGLSFRDLLPSRGTAARIAEEESPAVVTAAPAATSSDDAEAVWAGGAVDSDHGNHAAETAIDSGHEAGALGAAREQPSAEDTAVTSDDADQQVAAAPVVDLSAEARCAYCGMYAHKSESRIVARWSGGSVTQHDCWDCAFGYAADERLVLESAQVAAYGGSLAEPRMLDAARAWYLYETKPIKGSMPPYVAAFDDRSAAEAARAELGGEVVDFAGLQRMWE